MLKLLIGKVDTQGKGNFNDGLSIPTQSLHFKETCNHLDNLSTISRIVLDAADVAPNSVALVFR